MNDSEAEKNQSLTEVLKQESVVETYLHSSELVVHCFLENLKELVSLGLISNRGILQTRAFEILTSQNAICREAALSMGVSIQVIQSILRSDPVDRTAVARAADLVDLYLKERDEVDSKDFPFIMDFLNFLDLSAVVDLFVNVMEVDELTVSFEQWLLSLNFDSVLLEFNKTHNDPEWKFGMWSILNVFLRKQEMIEKFGDKLSAIFDFSDEMPWFVRQKEIMVLQGVLDDRIVPVIIGGMESFRRILEEEGETCIHADFVQIIKLMDYLILKKPDLLKDFDMEVLQEACFRVMTSFPDQSLALGTAGNVLLHLATTEAYRDEVIDRFVLIAGFVLPRSDQITMRAFCCEMMEQLLNEVNWEGFAREEFDALYSKFAVPYRRRVLADYGGPTEEVDLDPTILV